MQRNTWAGGYTAQAFGQGVGEESGQVTVKKRKLWAREENGAMGPSLRHGAYYRSRKTFGGRTEKEDQ